MPVIDVSHVTKEFRLGAMQSMRQTLQNLGARLTGRHVPERPLFKALDDVSFSVEQGEVLGIIGHNGAGKSTLLKMLARISIPTKGSVRVNGRIAPLIEVGAGFVPEFTGRENVYLNGSILGMSKKEIDRKFDEIVDFAEMAEFIDTPVKRYSSGMQVKLAFAVATSVESDILLVDEVLAVGDLAFQRKCFDRTEQLIRHEGRTVLIVSHNIRQIERMCKRVILMDHGKLIADTEPKTACDQFYAISQSAIVDRMLGRNLSGRYESSGDIDLTEIYVRDELGSRSNVVTENHGLTVCIRIHCRRDLEKVTIGLGLHTTDFVYLTTHSSELIENQMDLRAGEHEVELSIRHFPLLPGTYMWRMGVSSGLTGKALFYGENLLQTTVRSSMSKPLPPAMREGFFVLDADWTFGNIENSVLEQEPSRTEGK